MDFLVLLCSKNSNTWTVRSDEGGFEQLVLNNNRETISDYYDDDDDDFRISKVVWGMKMDRMVGKRHLKNYSSYLKTCFRVTPRHLDLAVPTARVLLLHPRIILRVPVLIASAVPRK